MADNYNERLEKLFSAALAKGSETERDAFLDLACGDDLDLRFRIQELLSAYERVGSFLDEPPVGAAPGNHDTVSLDTSLGSKIGRYKILQKLGEGGFGSVYMAEQEVPVHRRVALKIIKLGMDTKQVIARFEAEQQALAMMDHPNIARVFDAGATETGRPYFVMELVKGIKITEYCDRNKLSVQDRLELMIPVCQAVQHAHQKGIIHRDLKPSNVLVAIQDSKPVPKVIDFGIAKATTQRLTDKTLYTEFQQFIGTPEYMSPDQAEVSGLDMDTRTDIYSLGVLIYELMTGVTPFDASKLRDTSYDEIRRVIRDEDPPKPSERLRMLGETKARSSSAELYKEEPLVLARMIQGDLDWIVMKALEKDRTRRYATAKDLADDIQHYLQNEPIMAGPPDLSYKLRKFVQRHRVSVIVGTLVGLAMITGLSLATIGLVQANRAKTVLLQERNAAESARAREQEQRTLAETNESEALKQVAKSTTVIGFLEEMLRSVDPSKALGREVSIRYVLDEAGKKIDEGALADQPEVEAAVRMTLGDTYQALGLYDAAEAHVRQARDLRNRLLGHQHPDTLRASRALAGLIRIKGRFAEAETLLRETARIQHETLGREHPDTLATMNELALSLWGPGRFEEAETIHREILEIQERVLGPDHAETAKSLGHLGAVCRALGKMGEAEPLLRRSLDLCLHLLGEEHPSTTAAMNNLGLLLEDMGRLEQAEDLFRRTFTLDRRILGPDHPRTRIPLNNLLRVLTAQNKTEAIEPLLAERISLLKRAAEKAEASSGAIHAYAWELLNCDLPKLRDPWSALPMAQKAVAMDQGAGVDLLETLAQAYQMNGSLDMAIETQQRAIAKAGRRGLYDLAELEAKLLDYQLEQGDLVGAMGGLWEGVAGNVGGWLIPDVVPDTTLSLQAEKLMAEHRYAEASAVLRGCLAIRQKTLTEGHWLIADTLSQLGESIAAEGRLDEAEPLLLDAYADMKDNRLVAENYKNKALQRIIGLYEAWGKADEARTWSSKVRRSDS